MITITSGSVEVSARRNARTHHIFILKLNTK